jgi:hypothetical protein
MASKWHQNGIKMASKLTQNSSIFFRGTGPFSATLEVRPEPSLAHMGAVAGISDGGAFKGVAWVTPLVIGFVVAIALIGMYP